MSTPLGLYANIWDITLAEVLQISVQRSDPVTYALTTYVVPAVATNEMITQWERSKKRSNPGTIRVCVLFGNAFANAIIEGVGGPTYKGPTKKYLVQFWNNGGAGDPLVSCWLENVKITLSGADQGVLIDAQDMFAGFGRTRLDHMTYNGSPLSGILHGDAGTIPITVDPSSPNTSGGSTAPGPNYPSAFVGVRGLDKSIALAPSDRSPQNVSKFQWAFVADNSVHGFADTAITVDTWDDTIANTLQITLRSASGKYFSGDSAPLGARAHYHVDHSKKTVLAGYVGTVPKITLYDTVLDGTYQRNPLTSAWFDATKLVINPALETIRAQAQFIGGSSNHGLPGGSTITGLENIFPGAAGKSGYLHLSVISCSTGSEGGGVYYYLHDGVLRRLSQTFDVTCMAYDGTTGDLVVGTQLGVFSWNTDPAGLTKTPTFLPLGGLRAKVLQLCIPKAGTIWALADEGNGAVSVFEYPAIGADDNSANNFAGWSRPVKGGTITAMSGGYGNLYFVDSSDPTTLQLQQPGKAVQNIGGIGGPMGGAGIVGLDYLPTRTSIAIRTTAGADGLYCINFTDNPTQPLNLNPGKAVMARGGLADEFGYVMVNRVTECGAGNLNGSVALMLAATGSGAYYTDGVPGSEIIFWKPATAASGVGDRSIDFVGATPTQTVLGHSFERMYAASANTYWVSNSGGFWFYDVMQGPLDKGAFWTALAGLCGQPIPNNDVGAIGGIDMDVILGPANGALSGNLTLTLPATSNFNRKGNIVRVRRLTSRNDFSWRTVQVDSSAPYFAIEIQILAEIVADDSRGAITAGEQLDEAEFRFLSENSENVMTFQLEGMTYNVQESPFASLNTGDMIAVNANQYVVGAIDRTVTQIVDWTNEPFYVLEFQEVLQNNTMAVNITAGNKMSLVEDLVNTLKEIVSGTSDGLSRDKRYRRIQ